MKYLPQSKAWVVYAAWGCVIASILHVVTIFAGAAWFDFLGAPPEYGQMMRDGNYVYPVIVTLLIAGTLAIWAAYAFSALKTPLPYARLILGAVAAIFLLRGIIGIPINLYILTKTGPTTMTLFHIAASVFVLTLGWGFVAAFRRAEMKNTVIC